MNKILSGIIFIPLIGGGHIGGCSKSIAPHTPKYSIGDCVRSIDSFGDFEYSYYGKVLKINEKEYQLGFYSLGTIIFSTGTRFIESVDDELRYKKVPCQ